MARTNANSNIVLRGYMHDQFICRSKYRVVLIYDKLDIMANSSEKESKEQKKHHQDQNTVLTSIFIAFILIFCYVAAAVYFPFPKFQLPTLLNRVVFTLRWLMVSLLAIFAGVMAVGYTRFFTAAINPLDPSGKKYTEQLGNYLQNTVEQFLLHSFSLLTLSTYLSEEKMYWIPVMVVLFTIARAVFFVGYYIDPMKRGVGFAMTWFPNIALSAYCLYCICVYGVQSPL